ncbi:MAG TPA: AAA family ATPase, partial [Anaerolineae bacterium]
MRFKYLSLHGFKTFANKTEFVFDLGVTAVVGPNGSGKSNIADAVRWVMGENSYTNLRVKKTEDLVFSGSSTRPRLGMAEVSMTLENPNPWTESATEDAENIEKEEQDDKSKARVDPVTELLKSNPSEVTIGRRAY